MDLWERFKGLRGGGTGLIPLHRAETGEAQTVALADPPNPATYATPGHSKAPDDPLGGLVATKLKDLTEPLPVASTILGETVWFCANDHQAAAIQAKGGTPYTPPEVAILRDLYAAVKPEVWAERLRLIHQAKKEFQGKLEP